MRFHKKGIISFKKGEQIIISTDEYSSYDVCGLFEVAENFNADDLADQFLKENKISGQYNVDYDKFIAFLCNKKLINDLTFREFHLGDYGNMELSVSGEQRES